MPADTKGWFTASKTHTLGTTVPQEGGFQSLKGAPAAQGHTLLLPSLTGSAWGGSRGARVLGPGGPTAPEHPVTFLPPTGTRAEPADALRRAGGHCASHFAESSWIKRGDSTDTKSSRAQKMVKGREGGKAGEAGRSRVGRAASCELEGGGGGAGTPPTPPPTPSRPRGIDDRVHASLTRDVN